MRPPRVVIALPFVLALLAAVRAEDRKKLSPRYAAKDVIEVDASSTLELSVTLSVPSANIARTTTQVQAQGYKLRDEVLEAAPDGSPRRVRRRYAESWEAEQEPGMRAPERRSRPLEKRTLELALDAKGRLDIRVPEGSPPLASEAVEGERLQERWDAALPSGDVAPGATWKLEGKELGALFGGSLGEKPEGALEARFDQVKELALEKGAPREPVAIVKLKVRTRRVDDETEEEGIKTSGSMEAELTGELRFALDRGKIVSLFLKGEARIEQERKDNAGGVMHLKMRGPFSVLKRVRFPKDKGEDRPR